MMNRYQIVKLMKKIIISIIFIGLIYTLSNQTEQEISVEASTTIIQGNTNSEAIQILNTASMNIQPYHYSNKQTLSLNRLKQVTSDLALPSQYGEVMITWESNTSQLVISQATENFTVASPQGSLSILVYKATVTELPSIIKGAEPFILTAYLYYNDAIISKTYKGALVATMPTDFYGGVLFTMIRYGSLFLEGVITTLGLSLMGTVIGFILALFLVFLRLQSANKRDKKSVTFLKKIAVSFAKGYITLFRGTPMIVQASFFWYGLGLFGNALICGLVVVSLNTAAYIAEILRGSINSVDKGQTEASRSLGLSHIQTMKNVILPQAIQNSMPAIGNEFVINVKDTAVLSVIGIFELFNQTTKIAGIHYRQLEAYLVVALIYLVLTYTITKFLQKIEKRFDIKTVELPSSN